MKCIRCSNDCTYPERQNKRCPKCHGEFAFEPRTGDVLTDAAFKAAIDTVSANGKLRFGVENLYYEVCRRRFRSMSRPPLGCVIFPGIIAIILLVSGLKYGTRNALPLATVVGVIALICAWLRGRSKFAPVLAEDFRKMYDRWNIAHGVPSGVIVRQPQPSKPRGLESDIADYSFDRAVICDRARTVDLLLANNFHFENNCAVLPIAGYPPGPFETVRTMLKRNPRLQVFVIHDATAAGCGMAHRLASDPKWFTNGLRVVDVGLRPRHAGPFQGLLQKSKDVEIMPINGITPAECKWLGRYALELAAIRPEQILKRLFRAINRLPEEDTAVVSSSSSGGGGDGGGSVEQDNDSFSSDAGDSDGGADSFG